MFRHLLNQAALKGVVSAFGCWGRCVSCPHLVWATWSWEVIPRHRRDAFLLNNHHWKLLWYVTTHTLSHITGRLSFRGLLQVSMRNPSSAIFYSPYPWTPMPNPPHGKQHFQVWNRCVLKICRGFRKPAEIQQAGWCWKVKYQSFLSGILVSTFNCFHCCNSQL